MPSNSDAFLAKYEQICRAVESRINPNIAYLINEKGTGFTILDTYRRDEIEVYPEFIPCYKTYQHRDTGKGLIIPCKGFDLVLQAEIAELIREGIEIAEYLGAGIYFDKKEKRRVVLIVNYFFGVHRISIYFY